MLTLNSKRRQFIYLRYRRSGARRMTRTTAAVMAPSAAPSALSARNVSTSAAGSGGCAGAGRGYRTHAANACAWIGRRCGTGCTSTMPRVLVACSTASRKVARRGSVRSRRRRSPSLWRPAPIRTRDRSQDARAHGRQAAGGAGLFAPVDPAAAPRVRSRRAGDFKKTFARTVGESLPASAHVKPLEVWFQDAGGFAQIRQTTVVIVICCLYVLIGSESNRFVR